MLISETLASSLQASFGLTRGVVTVSPTDPAWPSTYHQLAAELLPMLPDSVVTIEHVGSTAVPGLAAKPILDITVGVREGADPKAASRALEDFGFLRRGDVEGAELDRTFGFELADRVRLINAHMIRYAGSEWTQYVMFRDRLRADILERDKYARIKSGLAEEFPSDRQSYIAGKTAFVLDSQQQN